MQRRNFTRPVSRDSAPYDVLPPQNSQKAADLAVEVHKIQKLQRYKSLKKFALISIGLIILTLLTTVLMNYIQHKQITDRVPAEIRQDLTFPLYIPSSATIQVKPQSFTKSQGIVSFQLTFKNNEFTVSAQEKPNGFELGNYVNGVGISQGREVGTANGKALVGQVMGRSIAILASESTLTTITGSGSSTVSPEELEILLKDLKKS